MGLLSFLKGIFSDSSNASPHGSPQAQSETLQIQKEEIVPVYELEQWFNAKEAEINKEISVAFEECKAKLPESLNRSYGALEVLKAANPRYPKLYEQGKNLADGNKIALVIATENLIKELKLPENINGIPNFIRDADYSMNVFTMDTNRSFIITKEFWTDEALKLKESIQGVDQSISNLKQKVQHHKIWELDNAKKQITDLTKKHKRIAELEKEYRDLAAKIVDAKLQLENVKQECDALLMSEDYQRKQKLEAELTELQSAMKAHEAELYGAFANLDTPLRKLAYGDAKSKKQIEKYSNNLIEALNSDTNFNFREILIKLKLKIESGEIKLDGKKGQQAVKDIEKINQTFVQNWLAMHKNKKFRESELQATLKEAVAAKKETEIKEKQEKLETELEKLDKKKVTIEKGQKKADLTEDLEAISKNLSMIFGKQIKIAL